MLDSHSQMHSKTHRVKLVEGKSINLSSPSSYTSSSPSSTSSLSSTSNVQHQKQAMSGQTLNGSSEYISKKGSCVLDFFIYTRYFCSARHSQHAKFQSPTTNARRKSSKFSSSPAHESRRRLRVPTSTYVNRTSHGTRTRSPSVAADATTSIGKWTTRPRNSRRSSSDSNASR